MKRPRLLFSLLILGACLIALGTILYSAYVARPLEETTYIPKNTPVTPEIQLLRDYVRIDTSNPPGNERSGAAFLLKYLQENGIAAELIEPAPGRSTVYARIRGRSDHGGLLLLQHIDVVPADPRKWTHPPFAAEISLNMMWGRGTLDMKGIGVCELLAFTRVARSGRVPEHDLVFLATADEEQGGSWGMDWLTRNRPDIFQRIQYALNEGGITETLADQITYVGVELGSKLACKGRLLSRDKQAIEQARIALEPLQMPEDPQRILPEVAYFLRRIAPHRIKNRDELADITATVRNGKFWRVHSSFRALTQNTLFLGSVRTVVDHYEVEVNLENLFDQQPEPVARLIEARLPAGVTFELQSVQRPVHLSNWDTEFCSLIQRTMKRAYGANVDVGPQLLQFSSSDSRFLRKLGIEAYGLWPFPVTLYQTEGIHGQNETIRLDWFLAGIAAMSDLVDSWSGVSQAK